MFYDGHWNCFNITVFVKHSWYSNNKHDLLSHAVCFHVISVSRNILGASCDWSMFIRPAKLSKAQVFCGNQVTTQHWFWHQNDIQCILDCQLEQRTRLYYIQWQVCTSWEFGNVYLARPKGLKVRSLLYHSLSFVPILAVPAFRCFFRSLRCERSYVRRQAANIWMYVRLPRICLPYGDETFVLWPCTSP